MKGHVPWSADRRQVGRYLICGEMASGGMATVHLGRLLGPAGFSKIVAIKRLHAHFASDPEFLSMFIDEARLASAISHPNVVSSLDVVAEDGELLLVMEYVQGETLAQLIRLARKRNTSPPLGIVQRILCDALDGLLDSSLHGWSLVGGLALEAGERGAIVGNERSDIHTTFHLLVAQTSSSRAISAASPRRRPILVMRV